MPDMPDIDRLYREGVAAIRAGDRATGREKLMQVVKLNQTHEQAWLWLSAAVETDDERIICLENVLLVNPGHQAARRGLEELGVLAPAPPPAEPKAALTEHGAPGVLDKGMEALLSGDFDRLGEAETIDPGEAWRAQLLEKYSSEYSRLSDGTLLPALEEAPRRSLQDLGKAWLAALTFRVRGVYEEEIASADFRHIAVNLLTIAALQIVAGVVPAITLFIMSDGNFEPLLEPLAQFLERVGEINLAQLLPRQLSILSGILSLERVGRLSAQVRLLATQMTDSFIYMALGYAILVIALAFVGQMFRALITNSIANWFSKRGNVFQTMHALTIALVAAQIVQLPIAILSPILPLVIVMWIGAAIQIYRIALATVALNTVYKFGILFSLATLMLSAIAIGLSVGLLLSIPFLFPA